MITEIKLNVSPKIIIIAPGIIEWVNNNLWFLSKAYFEKKMSKSQINANNTIRKNSRKVNLKK
jgi:hypothetical protein